MQKKGSVTLVKGMIQETIFLPHMMSWESLEFILDGSRQKFHSLVLLCHEHKVMDTNPICSFIVRRQGIKESKRDGVPKAYPNMERAGVKEAEGDAAQLLHFWEGGGCELQHKRYTPSPALAQFTCRYVSCKQLKQKKSALYRILICCWTNEK